MLITYSIAVFAPLVYRSWKVQPVFGWLAAMGGVSEAEMLRTFNCGVGAVLIVSPQHKHIVQSMVQGIQIGVVELREWNDEEQVRKNVYLTQVAK